MASLTRLMNPRTIAVIGGSECERVIEQCDKFGFTGTIWPVHPKRQSMAGRTCFKSIDDLPAVPDVAYVAVNRIRSVEIVRTLAQLGVGGAICYAAGFAEAVSEDETAGDLQNQLVQAAGTMPLIGPNCYGYINALERVAMWPDQHGALPVDSGVAILTQSSNVAINLTMQKRGLPIAVMMTAGNQAQLGLSELALALIEDKRITALGLHIEGLDDVKKFEQLALRARELGKPIIALKVGKSEQAQAATITHTASLAGSDVAHDALFKRLGVGRVSSLEVFLESLKLLHSGGVLRGNEILSLSCSGGEASLMADAGEGVNVSYRPFTPDQKSALSNELGEIVTIANPLDYNTFVWGDWLAMQRMFEVALSADFDLALLVNDYPRADRCDDADWRSALDSFLKAAKATGKRVAIVASLAETMPEELAIESIKQGVAPLCGIESAIQAIAVVAGIGKAWSKPVPEPLVVGDAPTAGTIVTLDEKTSKTELSKFGLIVPHGSVVQTKKQCLNEARLMTSPYVLKALGIAHKSESGAVQLSLQNEAELSDAFDMLAPLSENFLLEEMAAKPLAELIVGVTHDPVCGLVLTLGAGGVLTELLDDSASVLLPASETEIRETLASLKVSRLLGGFRDHQAADIDALIANIICIADYAVSNCNTLVELDVNPLFASQFGSIAVDALIVKRNTHE